MAQHDMNIANQGFPATRADINNALNAIATNNSGTSEPSTTFANQWFYNTNTNKLFIRNEANNAFIEVATLDQTNNEWQITTGTIQAKDSDGLALKTDDGTTRLLVNDSGLVTVSSSLNLGTTTDAATVSTTASDYQLQLGAAQSTTGDIGRNISFDVSGTTTAAINTVDAGTSNAQALAFFTGNSSGITEAMRIDSSQNVGIGGSPSAKLDVRGGIRLGTTIADVADGGRPILYASDGSGSHTSHALVIQGRDGAGSEIDFVTGTTPTTRMQIGSSGHVLIGTETGDGFNDDSMLRIGRSGDRAFLQFKTDTSNKNGILFGDETDDVRHSIQFDPTNNTLSFIGDSAEHMTFTSAGNIGFGTADPDSFVPSNVSTGREIVNRATGGGTFIAARDDSSVTAGNIIGAYLIRSNDSSGVKFGGMRGKADDTAGNFHLEFFAGNSTTDTSGALGAFQISDTNDTFVPKGGVNVGKDADGTYNSTEEQVAVFYDNSATFVRLNVRAPGSGGDDVFKFQDGTLRAEIEANGDFLSASNSYGSTSDERLKENIELSGSQWDDVKALQIKKYSMKEDNLDAPNMLGVIAQDLQASGMNGLVKSHTLIDADDNPILDGDGNEQNFLSVKYSILYMKAVKALQEAMAKIETLETEMTSVKSRLDALEG